MTLKEALDYRDELLAESERIERRKQRQVRVAAWIMLGPVVPLVALFYAAEAVQVVCEYIRDSRLVDGYVQRIAAWAKKRGVDLS